MAVLRIDKTKGYTVMANHHPGFAADDTADTINNIFTKRCTCGIDDDISTDIIVPYHRNKRW